METLTNIPVPQIITSGLIFIIGLITARLLSAKIEKAALKRLSPHQSMLIRRFVYSIVFILFLISGLQQLGFHFSVLLGAAGVFTVAISFASQTSVSNLISGVFLLIERPFKVGDTIQVKNLLGKVYSIDLLSTKIVTSDNKLIRLPNESLIKTEITNLSFFKTRRLDLLIGISYESDIKLAISTLKKLLENSNLILTDPKANVDVNKLLDCAIELKISIWLKAADLRQFKTDFHIILIDEFKKLNIELPYPQLVIHKSNDAS